MKHRITAVLLCFFLGFLGIHKFYLNENKAGILYLILTITGIGSIISVLLTVYDFCVLITTPDNKFDSKYNK